MKLKEKNESKRNTLSRRKLELQKNLINKYLDDMFRVAMSTRGAES